MKQTKHILLLAILATAIMVLSACGGDDEVESGKIVVAGKDYTEQIIMTNILGEYLKANTDLDVEVKDALGGVFVLQEAMEKGDIDTYVEYTGTGYLNVLKEDYEAGTPESEFYEATKDGYMDEYNIKWMEPFGFNNQYALTLRGEQADELGIEKASELAEYSSDLVFGSVDEFYERGDGFDEMVEAYDLEFADTVVIDEDLMYKAEKDEEMDVITGYTTDPRISEYDLVNLEDDKEFFPPYAAVPIIRQEVLDANDGLEETINKLAESGAFTNESVTELNKKVNTDGEKEDEVAIEFLKENDLID